VLNVALLSTPNGSYLTGGGDCMKEEVYKILESREPKLCVLATSDKSGKTEAATLVYTIEEDLTILLSTKSDSRKWNNLLENDQVSLVFGFSFTEANIQYDGIAKLIDKNSPEYASCEQTYFTDHPDLSEYRGQANSVFFKITPRWLRLSDYSKKPPQVDEMEL